MTECVACDTDLGATPYRCRYCSDPVCEGHRLPENHDCVYQSLTDAPDAADDPGRKRSRGRSETSTATPLRKETSDPDRATIGSSPPNRAPSSSDPPTNRSPPVETKSPRDASADTNKSLHDYVPSVSRRSLERKVGATVITLGKLAVVALAVVGALAIYQPGLLAPLGAAGVPIPAGGQPTATPAAAVEAAGVPTTTATETPTSTASDTATAVAGDTKRERVENLIHAKVNDRRRSNDLEPIEKDDLLRDIARSHSQEMAQQGYFAHESPSGENYEDRYNTFGYNCQVPISENRYATGGENIWMMTASTNPSAEAIASNAVRGWMDSPGHRENMMEPYWDDMGIGVYIQDGGGEVKIYATQNFC